MKSFQEILKNITIEKRAFINGDYTEGEDKAVMKKYSSYDGRDLSGITACRKKDVDKAVFYAKKAFETGIWRDKPPAEKKQILLKLADLMEENREELAALDTLETSRAYRNYYYHSIPKAIEAVRYFAECADKYYDMAVPPRKDSFAVMVRQPLGVAAVITPWNDPMVVSAWKFSPALLMGNSVILKPAEQSSLSAIKTAELAARAGIPKGVFQVLPGYGEEAGKALALHEDVRGVFFTGSSQVGKKIIEYSGLSNMKKVGLECGGKSPFLVSENCRDLKRAAEVLAENMFYNQGQICSAPSRCIVNKSVKAPFVELLKRECEKYVPGNPYEIQNNVGCVVSREQYEKVMKFIRQAEDEAEEIYQAETKKDMPENACGIQPTLIIGADNHSKAAKEEIFGPVLVVMEARNLKEAVDMANDTKYGLAAAIFTDDLNEAYYVAEHLTAGIVHINSYGEDDNMAPFGGFKESGFGKDKSVIAFDEYSQLKTIWMKTAAMEDR